MTTQSSIARLAHILDIHLRGKNKRSPTTVQLEEALTTVYYASMNVDEARSVICTIAFVDRRTPGGQDPPYIRPQRRTYTKLSSGLAYNIRNLTKISQASAPWAACLAICSKSRRLEICGFFDQEFTT